MLFGARRSQMEALAAREEIMSLFIVVCLPAMSRQKMQQATAQ